MSDIDTVDSPQAEPAVTGLDNIIDAAIDKQSAPEADTPPSPASEGDTVIKDGKTYHRDPETGKFAKKEVSAEGVAPDAAPAEPTPVAEPAPQPLEPPARWSDADKALFATLPPDAQKVLVEREKAMEGDYTRKTQEVAEARKHIEPVLSVMQEWSPYFQALNVPPAVAVRQLLNAEYTLRHAPPAEKLAAFQTLAKQYGVKLPTGQPTAEGQDPDALQDWRDPQVEQLGGEIEQLKGVIGRLQHEARESQRRGAEAEFAAIGATKDDAGNPKYPFWDRVKDRMIHLVASNQSKTWDDAYDASVWSDPELRKELQTKATADAAKAAREAADKQRQEAVQSAKKTAPVAESHGLSGQTKPKGLAAHLDSAMGKFGY